MTSLENSPNLRDGTVLRGYSRADVENARLSFVRARDWKLAVHCVSSKVSVVHVQSSDDDVEKQ